MIFLSHGRIKRWHCATIFGHLFVEGKIVSCSIRSNSRKNAGLKVLQSNRYNLSTLGIVGAGEGVSGPYVSWNEVLGGSLLPPDGNETIVVLPVLSRWPNNLPAPISHIWVEREAYRESKAVLLKNAIQWAAWPGLKPAPLNWKYDALVMSFPIPSLFVRPNSQTNVWVEAYFECSRRTENYTCTLLKTQFRISKGFIRVRAVVGSKLLFNGALLKWNYHY